MTPIPNDPQSEEAFRKPESKAKELLSGSNESTEKSDSHAQAVGSLQTAEPDIPSTNDESKSKPQKHPLDWVLALFALISLLLNIYLLFDKRKEQSIKQPGPEITRIVMPARDALILVGLKERRDLFFSHFPNPSFLLSPEWKTLLSKPPQTDLELRDTKWRFLTIQNTTESAYEDVRIENGNRSIADLGNLPSKSTLFVYATTDDSFDQAVVSYKVRGTSPRSSSSIPPIRPNEVLIKTEFEVTKLGSLEGIDDRTKALIQSKNTAFGMQPK